MGQNFPTMEPNQVQHSLQTANSLIQAGTIRRVDDHVNAFAHLDMSPDSIRISAEGDPDETLAAAWEVARPVFSFLEAALFLAPGWHNALKGLQIALDVALSVVEPPAAEKDADTDEENNMPL